MESGADVGDEFSPNPPLSSAIDELEQRFAAAFSFLLARRRELWRWRNEGGASGEREVVALARTHVAVLLRLLPLQGCAQRRLRVSADVPGAASSLSLGRPRPVGILDSAINAPPRCRDWWPWRGGEEERKRRLGGGVWLSGAEVRAPASSRGEERR